MTDQTAMDLDQNAIMYYLVLADDESYEVAKAIYDHGSYTDVYAVMQLTYGGIPAEIPKGTEISGRTMDGTEIIGEAYEDIAAGVSSLKFKYPITDVAPPNQVGCIVGQLPEAWQITGGCLKEIGTIVIDGHVLSYTHSIADGTMNGRSFKKWSTDAESQMSTYSDFSKFKEYYGRSDFADEWITAALVGRATNFTGTGGADFSTYGFGGRKHAAMKGTAYITDPMITIRQLEYGLDLCQEADQDASIYAWDEGVAFYTGSMILGDPGILMYALGEKRCGDFSTCGRNANESSGTSYVNLEMFDIFNLGQDHLRRGECDPIRDLVDRAVSLMSIPVIQGTLRYAYKISSGMSTTEVPKSEGAVFAAGVLPRVHYCNEADAEIIYDNMKVGALSTDYDSVLKAFENNYECLGITDEEIGVLTM